MVTQREWRAGFYCLFRVDEQHYVPWWIAVTAQGAVTPDERVDEREREGPCRQEPPARRVEVLPLRIGNNWCCSYSRQTLLRPCSMFSQRSHKPGACARDVPVGTLVETPRLNQALRGTRAKEWGG